MEHVDRQLPAQSGISGLPRLQSFEDATQFDTILVSPPNNIR